MGNSPHVNSLLTSGHKPIKVRRMSTESLLADIDAFLGRDDVKITETTFGRLAVNDGKFVGRLRAGKSLTLNTFEKVQRFMREYKSDTREVA